MRRYIYVFDKIQQKVVPIEERLDGEPEKGDFHYVIPDEMEATAHPCTGEMITSKRKFREITRAHNCVEYGNERPTDRRNWDVPGRKEALREAFEKHGR